MRGAILQRRFTEGDALAFDMAGLGTVQVERAALALLHLRREHIGKLHITRLVMRRVGVGDVVGQDFGALGAEAQRLFMDAQGFVETDAHAQPLSHARDGELRSPDSADRGC
ncbi:hypothetical protein D3C77_458750 [compost metagenome]